MVTIIGIVGRAGSGKSTLAKGLLAAIPRSAPVSLATPFKLEGVALDGLPVTEVFGPDAKSPATRTALQQRGTEKGRDTHGADVWLKHADADIYRLGRYGVTTVIVDDVRFDNEAAWVKSKGGVLLKTVGRSAPLLEGTALHVSETAIDGIVGDLTLDTMSLDAQTCVTIAYGFLLGYTAGHGTPANAAENTNAHVEGGDA